MKKTNFKLNLLAIMLIFLGIVIIVSAILFFKVDPKNNEQKTIDNEIIEMV